MSEDKGELRRGCVVMMKAASGITGYGNAQCVSSVTPELGTLSLFGHNEHCKTYDVERVIEYTSDASPEAEHVKNPKDCAHRVVCSDPRCPCEHYLSEWRIAELEREVKETEAINTKFWNKIAELERELESANKTIAKANAAYKLTLKDMALADQVAALDDEVERLRHPSARSLLAKIIELLLERCYNASHYCEQAVADCQHDLAVLEAAKLYEPN